MNTLILLIALLGWPEPPAPSPSEPDVRPKPAPTVKVPSLQEIQDEIESQAKKREAFIAGLAKIREDEYKKQKEQQALAEKSKRDSVLRLKQITDIVQKLSGIMEPHAADDDNPDPPAPPKPADNIKPTLKLPDNISGTVGSPIKIAATTNGKEVVWYAIDDGLFVFPADLLKDSLTEVVWAMRPGTYRLMAVTALNNTVSDLMVCRIIITGQGPQPPPPDVDPKPIPDPPVPPPIPVPTGFRVLFVYESSANMTPAQNAVINSTEINAYMNSHCAKDSKGLAEWRKWDKDVPVLDSESSTIRELWKSVKPKLGDLPQIVIVTGGNAEIREFPTTKDSKAAVAEVLAMLKKVGGP